MTGPTVSKTETVPQPLDCPCCGKRVEASGIQNVAEMPLTKAQIRDMERHRICSILKEQGFEVEDRAGLPLGAV